MVAAIDAHTARVMAHADEDNTLEGKATAVSKFLTFLRDMDVPAAALTSQSRNPLEWTDDRHQFHEALLVGYCSRVTVSHKTAASCMQYASHVAIHWRKAHGRTLWTTEMFDNLKPYIRGLIKIKAHVAKKRLGLSAPDVLVLLRTLEYWSRLRMRTTKRSKWRWGGHYTSAVGASYAYTYGVALRYGEATTPSNKDFDHVIHTTHADVEVIPGVRGGPAVMRIRPPKFKVNNKFSSDYITGEILPDDPLNWPSLILKMMALDPVVPQWRSRTPLFRDTRGLARDKHGRFPPGSASHGGGDALKYHVMLTTLRAAIDAESAPGLWFNGRPSAEFGLHSFRIGCMNDLVAAGASYFVVSAMGRWTSQSVLDYHRMQEATAHHWARRAQHHAMSVALDETRPHEDPSLPRTDGTACFAHAAPVNAPAAPHAAIANVVGSVDRSLLAQAPPVLGSKQVKLDQWLISLPAPH
jgi:hypothetical protein